MIAETDLVAALVYQGVAEPHMLNESPE